eukprot:m.13467 g.13467  ORF g.13467 m.13467 type:complete len:373 (+) comp4574_c0_seq1:206-1324(+)
MEELARLKREIARKRKEIESTDIVQEGPSSKKYFKRGDLEKFREKKYLEEHRDDDVPDEKIETEVVLEEVAPGEVQRKERRVVAKAEVIKRLRARGEPIRLFGEDFDDVRERLRQIEISAPEVIVERQKNEFLEAMGNVTQDINEELLRKQGGEEQDPKKKHPPMTFEEMLALRKLLGKGEENARVAVYKFFKNLLRLWEKDLDDRSDELKRSTDGRIASATFKQTEAYLKPLFRKLKGKRGAGELGSDILHCLTSLLQHLLDREYIKANDEYLMLAIGNAAWPLGVTNVGIHSRTGREKIFSQKVAHVLNDEIQRKFIQGLKRLMTFMQKRFPTDPSRCLEFQGLQTSMYPVDNAKAAVERRRQSLGNEGD